MELALGIGGRAVPTALLPEDVVEIGIGVVVHTGTEIDEAFRPRDQCGQILAGPAAQRLDGPTRA